MIEGTGQGLDPAERAEKFQQLLGPSAATWYASVHPRQQPSLGSSDLAGEEGSPGIGAGRPPHWLLMAGLPHTGGIVFPPLPEGNPGPSLLLHQKSEPSLKGTGLELGVASGDKSKGSCNVMHNVRETDSLDRDVPG